MKAARCLPFTIELARVLSQSVAQELSTEAEYVDWDINADITLSLVGYYRAVGAQAQVSISLLSIAQRRSPSVLPVVPTQTIYVNSRVRSGFQTYPKFRDLALKPGEQPNVCSSLTTADCTWSSLQTIPLRDAMSVNFVRIQAARLEVSFPMLLHSWPNVNSGAGYASITSSTSNTRLTTG